MLKRPRPLVSTNLLGGHSWIFIVIQAVCAIVLGGIFLCHPGWAMIVLALALGIMLLGCGIQQLILTFLLRRRFSIGRLLYGLVLLIAGAFLVLDPLLGVLELLLILVGGVYVMEAVSVILQVASFRLTGKRIFLCAPIHHHFERKGWTETQIVVRFWILAGVFALMALATLKLR